MRVTYVLNSENIDVASGEVRKFMEKQKVAKQDIIRTCLSMETMLLEWQERMPEGTEFVLNCYVKLFRPIVRIVMAGKCCDPEVMQGEEEDYFALMQGNLGLATTFKYQNGLNIYDIKMPLKSIGSTGKIALAIVAALVTWQVMGFMPVQVADFLNKGVIAPTFNMLLGLIKAVAGMLIFFNVISAVSNMGDFTTLSRLGKGLMYRAQMVNLFCLLVSTAVGAVTFDVLSFDGGFSLESVGEIYKMLLGVVPTSMVEPFATGNTLQILFLAVCGGLLFLVLDQQVGDVVHLVNQCNLLFMTGISYFCSFVPVIIYLSFTGLLLSGGFLQVLKLWKIILLVFVMALVFIVGYTVWTAWRNGFLMRKHFANILPVAFLAFSTASSAACVPLIGKTLTENKVDAYYRGFAVPLSQIVCAGGVLLAWPVLIFGLLAMDGGTISLPSLLVNMVSYWLLAQTAPPVAGGSISLVTLLILQVGLPQQYVALYIAVDLFLDMIETCACKVHVLNCVFACAKAEGKIRE